MQLYFIQIYNMYYIFSSTKIKAKELSSHPLLCSNRKMAFMGHFSGLSVSDCFRDKERVPHTLYYNHPQTVKWMFKSEETVN